MAYKYWTEAEIQEAIKLYRDGYNFSQIGTAINRDKSQTRNKLVALGVHKVEKKLNKEYYYKVGEIVNETLQIVKQIRVKRKNQKGYMVQSLVYPTAPIYEIVEGDLKRGYGCAYKRGYRIFEGNSLYSVKSIRGNIVDINQAKTIPPNHTIKVKFKCENEDCSHTKKMTPSNLIKQGFSCNVCSKNVSYGELAFGQYSEYFNLEYKSEKVLKTLNNRRVDFVKFDSEGNIVNFVEIQGIQHSDKNNKWYEVAHEQDMAKREWAKATDTLMIEIDMRISSWEYFKKQINKCEHLPSINDEDEQAILELMEKNKRYPITEIVELYTVFFESTTKIGERFNVSNVTIGNILEKNGIEIRKGYNQYGPPKHIRCIETGVIYENLTKAHEATGIGKSCISAVCSPNSPQKSAGGYTWEHITE